MIGKVPFNFKLGMMSNWTELTLNLGLKYMSRIDILVKA